MPSIGTLKLVLRYLTPSKKNHLNLMVLLHRYFQFLLILLLSFDMNSHQKGMMLYILSDCIMNYECVCPLGLAILAFGLVSFFDLRLPTMG